MNDDELNQQRADQTFNDDLLDELEARTMKKIRVEFLLPVESNEGHPFPEEMYQECIKELTEQFGGCTFDTYAVSGVWQSDSGEVFRDDMYRLFSDFNEVTPKITRSVILELQEKFRKRFSQECLYVVSFPIEVY